jgi:GNAT superfamily N-acetyltransferase
VSTAEIHESHAQIRGAWRHFARSCRKGELIDTPDVSIAAGNVTWPMMNVAFLPAPVESETALERAVVAAARGFEPHKRGWMFFLSEDWVAPAVREKIPQIFGAHGLKSIVETMGMVSERLAPPVRPLPSIEVRRITEEEGMRHIADINSISYGIPVEMGREAVASLAMFQGDCQGYVGHAEGRAVSAAAILRLEGIAYVAMVATLPEHRQRGYAEAVIRHGLAEAQRAWRLERTVLHATPAGYSIYRRMGYRDVTRFGFYLAGGPGQ